jgi:hypothetical protein
MTRGYGHFLGFIGDWVRFARRDDLPYRTLGVSEAADDAEIEQAYLRLMVQYQPERLAGLAGSLRRRAQKKAVEIDTAYARIRAMRRRAVSAQTAVARSDERAMPAALVWLALALIAVVILAWMGPMRDLWAPAQANPDAAALPSTPPSPAIAAPPPSASAPPVAEAEPPVRVEQVLVLMPSEAAPAQPVSPTPPAPPALSGEAALVEAIRVGQLRPASGSDVSRWAMRWSEVNRRSLPTSFEERTRFMSSYVIQKDFTIPEGLNGANAVIFLLDTRVPYPRGNPGHSMILDLSTGACMGVTCRMSLD